jgi:hypothetical protein
VTENRDLDIDIKLEGLFSAAFPTAWLVMLALGALHLDVNRSIPHPGFLLVLLVFMAAAAVVTFIRKAIT